jgi:hypothetical protein
MKVAVPWLQHSQRFGHCALSQTVCNCKSEISALVEKKTGFDGNRTLIQGGFCDWCRAGSIFAHDISNKSYNVKNVTKVKSPGWILNSSTGQPSLHVPHLVEQFRFACRRHSSYDFWHDSDPVASGFKLRTD